MGVLPELLVKVPPAAPSSHMDEVAVPPNDPPSADVVAPWQIAVVALPAFTEGPGFTVSDLFAEVVLQEPPLVVSVNVTGLDDVADAI